MIEVIKQAALEAVRNSQPCDIFFGTVIQTSPLVIETDDKLVLTAAFLVLTRNVTEHTIEMTIDRRAVYLVHKGLTVGERVLLLRKQGGQTYVVMDRLEIPA